MRKIPRHLSRTATSLILASALVLTTFVACTETAPPAVEDPVTESEQELRRRQRAQCARDSLEANAVDLVQQGRETFRRDTFGDEDFWGDVMGLHLLLRSVSPETALGLGLKVDSEALPDDVKEQIRSGQLCLDDPAVTVQLLRLGAVVGIEGFFDDGNLVSAGITCALCHSEVDDSVAPGIGKRLDGWANRDLNVGAIIASLPGIQAFADALQKGVPETRDILLAWGPGKFDAQLILDGKGFQPDGRSAATLIPPAFGLAGVNLHTWTGWGSVPYWNAFVANLLMRGKGTFFDPRLNDPDKFPLAVANGYARVDSDPDLITPKLPELHLFQLAMLVPVPKPGSFDAAAAARGEVLFNGKAMCASCHVPPIFTEPGWNMHLPEEIGIDGFQASRSPDERYRTAPLRALFTHQEGGFYHDGRFPTLAAVIEHYNGFFGLGLTPAEKADLEQYLLSI